MGDVVEETTVVFPGSVLSCTTITFEGEFFHTKWLLGSRVFPCADLQIYQALCYTSRLCELLATRGQIIKRGQHLVKYSRSENSDEDEGRIQSPDFKCNSGGSFSATAQDGIVTLQFHFPQVGRRHLVLNNGVFFKTWPATGRAEQSKTGYTSPEANYELWCRTASIWADKLLGKTRCYVAAKLENINLDDDNFDRPLAIHPKFLLNPLDKHLLHDIHETVAQYVRKRPHNYCSLPEAGSEVESFSRFVGFNYTVTVCLWDVTESTFQLKLRAERLFSKQTKPIEVGFRLADDRFLYETPAGLRTCERQAWLDQMFLMLARVWTKPAQFIAFWEKDGPIPKLETVVRLKQRVQIVEKEAIICSICVEHPIDSAYEPCGHTLCSGCVKKQEKSSTRPDHCWLCSKRIGQVLKLYFP